MYAPELKYQLRQAVKLDMTDISCVYIMREIARKLQNKISENNWLSALDLVEESAGPASKVNETTAHQMRALLFLMADTEPRVMALIVSEMSRSVILLPYYQQRVRELRQEVAGTTLTTTYTVTEDMYRWLLTGDPDEVTHFINIYVSESEVKDVIVNVWRGEAEQEGSTIVQSMTAKRWLEIQNGAIPRGGNDV